MRKFLAEPPVLDAEVNLGGTPRGWMAAALRAVFSLKNLTASSSAQQATFESHLIS